MRDMSAAVLRDSVRGVAAAEGVRHPRGPGGPLMPLRVVDVKQYVYCPRIIYYTYVLPVERVRTFKMDVGREEHAALERLEARRTLARYGLDAGQRRFRVPLSSKRLGLSGVLDLLVESPQGLFPVEYKFTEARMGAHHKYQLLAYCLLVEEAFGVPVRRAFVYLVPREQVVPVLVTDSARLHTRRILGAVRGLIEEGKFPSVRWHPARCRDCEFLNYCSDMQEGAGWLAIGPGAGRQPGGRPAGRTVGRFARPGCFRETEGSLSEEGVSGCTSSARRRESTCTGI